MAELLISHFVKYLCILMCCFSIPLLSAFLLTGFKSIHDSLTSLQQIQKTKMDLEKYKVQKDLKKLQRKIVELQEI